MTTVTCLNPKAWHDLPDVQPGTQVEREDGNVYTVAKDKGTLIDSKGYYVSPFTLERYLNQKLASITANADFPVELEDLS